MTAQDVSKSCRISSGRGSIHTFKHLSPGEILIRGTFFFSSPKDMLIDVRERGRNGEREGEKYRLVASSPRPDWGLNPQPSTYPDGESKQWPFTLWTNTQPTEPHYPGPGNTKVQIYLFILIFIIFSKVQI